MKQMFRSIVAAALVAGLGLTLFSGACDGAAPAPKPDDVKKMQAALPDGAPAKPQQARKVLVYGLANQFVHSSIPLGQETIAALGQKTGAFTATISNDPASFDADNLKQYDVVVLVSTTGHFLVHRAPDPKKKDLMDDADKIQQQVNADKAVEKQRLANLLEFVRGGKGLVGIHAATDAYYDSAEYGDVIGGFFAGHPWHEKVFIKIDDSASPLTTMFQKNDDFVVTDEIYQFISKGKTKDGKEIQPYSRKKLHVLLSLDLAEGKTAHKSKSTETDFGVSWIREAGKGRVYYCSLGHREEIYWNPTVLKFYLAGIQYAAGDLQADGSPSEK